MPRPPAGGEAATGAAPLPPPPRPPPGAAVAPAAGGGVKVCVTDSPFTHTSAVLLMRPSEIVDSPAPCGASMVFVNHTTPSKSSRPRDSQLPGTCMSFQSADNVALSGVRQSGLV